MRLTRFRAGLLGAAAALLVLAGAGPAARAQGTTTVAMELIQYNPVTVRVPAGTTITWVNNDLVLHTVTAEDFSWGSGEYGQGESWSASFDTPGTYPYFCNLPGHDLTMRGVVEVTP